jgi:alpha-glucosidase
VGPDVGGFSGDCVGELLARWTQLGAFTPFFRNHAAKGTCDQEPWVFGAEVEEICRRAIRMRYEWLPYLYTAFWQAACTGRPILRPLVYDYPDDPDVVDCCDQAMVGPDVMVAPVVRPGVRKRLVYLPAGDWSDFWTGERHAGGTYIAVAAPLERMPLFVRAGAIVPRGAWAPSVDQLDRKQLELHVYPAEQMRGEWYDDDGMSMAYQRGAFNHWTIAGSRDGDRLHLTLSARHEGYASPTRNLKWVLHGVSGAAEVRFEGQTLTWHQEGPDRVVETAFGPGTLTVSGLA